MLPPPPLIGTEPIPVDFGTSEPLDMTRKRTLGVTPSQTKGERMRDDLMGYGITQKSQTASAALVDILVLSFILLLSLHQHPVFEVYDEDGLGYSLALIA